MALTIGTQLGSHEITALLGKGGMGEVYRARDLKLKREVAIKILSDEFAFDEDRVRRFQREAEVLASLNHPNIAHIYGLDVGNTHCIVMELIEGETLQARINKGPIPLDETLVIAKQIAEALEAAHEKGVIHRDLKPGNVMLTSDGRVKVLDFGLAKAYQADPMNPTSSNAPTMADTVMTNASVILGTAAYMSPEQAKGKPVDKRADIWAFGCVLYEMLLGRRAFDGEGVSDTLARVIEREPDWTTLPARLSPALHKYLERCMHKDPRQRVQAIGDVRLALEGAFEMASAPTAAPVVVAWWRRVVRVSAAIAAGGAIAGSLTWMAMRQPLPRVSRLQVAPPGNSEVSIGYNDRDLAITPDGSKLIYIGNHATQIFVRELDALRPRPVFTGRPMGLFMSPDGQWIGFRDGTGTLKKVAVTGGPAVTLATMDGAFPSGATWGPDGTIILASESVETGLKLLPLCDSTAQASL
jgi:serine/threonine-protein kinase